MSEIADQVERLVELRERGALTSSDVSLLHENDALAKAFVEALADNAEWRELGGSADDQEAFTQAVLEKVKAGNVSEFASATVSKARQAGLWNTGSEQTDGPKRSQSRERNTFQNRSKPKGALNWTAWSAVAASILVACLIFYYVSQLGEPRASRIVARLGAQCRETTIVRNGNARPALSGATFREGDRLQTGSNGFAVLMLIKGTTQIEVGEDTTLMAASDPEGSGGQLFLLQKGTVRARVSPQAPGDPLRIQTEQSTASVMGTEFSLTALGRATSLAVTSGKVRLSQNKRPLSVNVAAGHCALDGGAPDGPILGAMGTLYVTCDNEFQLFFNGLELGSHDDWFKARRFVVPVRTGRNVIAVKGVNTGNVGGLLVDLRWGASQKNTMISSRAWKVARGSEERWYETDFDDSTWASATEHAAMGGGRWSHQVKAFPTDSKALWIWSAQVEAPLALCRHSFSGSGMKE